MVKQVLIIRKDLNMRRGKECSQASHSALAFLLHRLKETGRKNQFNITLTPAEQEWIAAGTTKITLQVENEKELMAIYQKATGAGLECHLVKDAGKTEFDGIPTITCLAIGPDEATKIDPITKDLKLY
jgi:PTH2 family peptidyl-tRNA hydrolase